MAFGKDDVKIVSKEKEFWIVRKENAERVLADMKNDVAKMPLLLTFQEEIVKMCEQKIKASK